MNHEDEQHLRAAQGWLELGHAQSAFDEVESIAPHERDGPEVLKIRWRIYNHTGHHASAFAVAQALARLLPREPQGFIWRSYSARRMPDGSAERALALLLEAAESHRKEPAIAFNLACLHCQMGRTEVAKTWLHAAYDAAKANGTLK
jgi:Flp pilus assembly protein TadD